MFCCWKKMLDDGPCGMEWVELFTLIQHVHQNNRG